MSRTASAFAVLLLTSSISHAQVISPWVGQKVVTKFKTPLKAGNQVVDEDAVFRIYTVERSEGDWLWLVAGGVSGWARSSDVVAFDKAIDFYTQEIGAKPGTAYAYLRRGDIWKARGETDNAIADYNEGIRLNPKDATAYNNRGLAWHDKKDYDKALADYNEAIRLDPKYALTYANRGNAWGDQKEYDKAISDYNEAIRLDPRNAQVFYNRGFVRVMKKEYDNAIVDFNEAIRLDPKFASAYHSRGSVWVLKKDFDKAIADHNEAIRLDPKLALAYFNRAIAAFLARRDGAGDGMKSVLEQVGWRDAMSQYAVILGHFAALRTGQGGQAKAFLDDAAARCDTAAWPYPVVKYLRGEIDEAKLLAGATDNDKMTEARCYLGLDALHKNRSAAALAQFRWVKENGNPSFSEYTIALAELDRLEAKPSGHDGP